MRIKINYNLVILSNFLIMKNNILIILFVFVYSSLYSKDNPIETNSNHDNTTFLAISMDVDSDNFAKRTSEFIHKYDDLINFSPTKRLTLIEAKKFSSFKDDSDEWKKEYIAKKETLNDEFKIAHKTTGIIDHYSKTARYSELLLKIENITSNLPLKKELERNVQYYMNIFNSNFNDYHKLFPDFFISTTDKIAIFFELYSDLGFEAESNLLIEIDTIYAKEEQLILYKTTPEFEANCAKSNSNLLSYEYLNTTDNSSPFKKYTFTKATVNPTFLRWLNKEGSIFQIDTKNYSIINIIPISEPFGRYNWGVWTDTDGTIVKNAYALKQNFIVVYKDVTSNKCFASNFTASFLEKNNVLVSNQDIKFTHTRIVSCK
ncbi:MAG: hypothetical protein M9897_08395 [Brumimicrobium sp.]|nr:hypothetical protein [Brumimicrobium sp.]